MTLHLAVELDEERPPAQVIPWPSIAAASAQLRRRRQTGAVAARAARPAVHGRVAPPPPIPIGSARR
jgi:hypothetical protein